MRTPFGGNEALGLAVRTPCIPITAYHFLGITTITAYVLLRKPKGACEAEGLRSSTGVRTTLRHLPSITIFDGTASSFGLRSSTYAVMGLAKLRRCLTPSGYG